MKKSEQIFITNQSLRHEGVILIYLFGSYASGFAHKESDVDIAVYLDGNIAPEEYFAKSLSLPKYFSKLYPGRIISITVLNQASALLKHEVLKNGKLLAELEEGARATFQIEAVKDYEDTRHLRQIQAFYLSKRISEGRFAKPCPDFRRI
ncbi:MAG: nucleotidyltransferase domain-containing protein [Candidatus Schekmanbacteria bacterium]|nr:nucleotidyltransferase domain-containing protein [Candidatus Schekmanbacteria bacterium]